VLLLFLFLLLFFIASFNVAHVKDCHVSNFVSVPTETCISHCVESGEKNWVFTSWWGGVVAQQIKSSLA